MIDDEPSDPGAAPPEPAGVHVDAPAQSGEALPFGAGLEPATEAQPEAIGAAAVVSAAAPAVADGELRPLAPEQVLADRVGGLVFAAIAALGAGFTLALSWILDWLPRWLDWGLAPAVLLLLGALFVFTWRWPLLEHRHTRWRVDASGMEIRKGVVWRRVISVPRSRVQHADVEQGPLQRRWGLATLALHTAGTEHARVTLEGLQHELALEVRDYLLLHEEDDVV